MKVRHELTKKWRLISWMKNFGRSKSLRNILGGLKSNVVYLGGPFTYLTLKFKISFVSRQANSVAYCLAREAKLYAHHHIFYLISSYIATILRNEII